VDVTAERWSGLAQTVAKPGPLALEVVDDFADRLCMYVELPR
jgi:hypothetical protein